MNMFKGVIVARNFVLQTFKMCFLQVATTSKKSYQVFLNFQKPLRTNLHSEVLTQDHNRIETSMHQGPRHTSDQKIV